MEGLNFEAWPGEFKTIAYILSGLAIGLPLLAIPKKVLGRIGKLPYLSPNWISFWRLPLCWIGFGLYFSSHPFPGFCLVVFSLVLDRLDGKVAVALDELNDPLHPGKTEMGKWFDPLIDKLTVPVPFVIFSYKGLLIWWIVAIIIASEVIGTLIRKPIIDWKAFSWLTSYVRKQEASGIGKTKILMQFSCLLICLPLERGWLTFSTNIANVALGLTSAVGILSVLSRLQLHKKLNAAVDEVSDGFHHNE